MSEKNHTWEDDKYQYIAKTSDEPIPEGYNELLRPTRKWEPVEDESSLIGYVLRKPKPPKMRPITKADIRRSGYALECKTTNGTRVTVTGWGECGCATACVGKAGGFWPMASLYVEDVPAPRAAKGRDYWYILASGKIEIMPDQYWDVDDMRHARGNYYLTEEDAKRAQKHLND
jgi:hypothetical protein